MMSLPPHRSVIDSRIWKLLWTTGTLPGHNAFSDAFTNAGRQMKNTRGSIRNGFATAMRVMTRFAAGCQQKYQIISISYNVDRRIDYCYDSYQKAWKIRIGTLPSASIGYPPNGLELENSYQNSGMPVLRRSDRLSKMIDSYLQPRALGGMRK